MSRKVRVEMYQYRRYCTSRVVEIPDGPMTDGEECSLLYHLSNKLGEEGHISDDTEDPADYVWDREAEELRKVGNNVEG